jgi:aerobic C4-dicarboxylate transport protein
MTASRLVRSLYLQVLLAVAVGVLIGHFHPGLGVALKPLGDGFIKLIKMLIAPIVFTTVVGGIARMGDLRKVGTVGLKTIVYFEVVTTLALMIGLVVGKVVRPGAGMHASHLDAGAVAAYTGGARAAGATDFILGIIPRTIVDAFAQGDVLQVLLFSLLFGVAVAALGPRVSALVELVDQIGHAMFRIVGLLMRLAPLGALGAIAFTVGKFGLGTLVSLGELVACFYLTSVLFIVLVLGVIGRMVGFSIFRFVRYIADEIFVVFGTSSSESVLPRLIVKMERAGCPPGIVGMVVPLGYSFNLDGTSIYLTLATLFVAQATDTPLSLTQELGLLAVLLLTSKGSAAVTGGGFVTLAATLSATRTVPLAGLSLLLGVDRFMSEARAITNLIGNGVATLAIARWERVLDRECMTRALRGEEPISDAPPASPGPRHPADRP